MSVDIEAGAFFPHSDRMSIYHHLQPTDPKPKASLRILKKEALIEGITFDHFLDGIFWSNSFLGLIIDEIVHYESSK